MSTLGLQSRIQMVNKYSHVDVYYGPYDNIIEAVNSIRKVLRDNGLTVGIYNADKTSIDEYWWKNGIEDSDLILKQTEVDVLEDSEIKNAIDVGWNKI